MNVAVYHFARFGNVTAAQDEAKQTVKVLKSLNLPTSTLVFADMEGAETNVSSVGTNLNQYWKTMSASGYTNHGVYTGGLYGASYTAATSGTVGAAKTWYAHYPYTPSKNNPLEKNYGAWQFSSTSYLPGYANNFIDASTDYVGLFSKQFDQILSTKTMSGVMQINQSNRQDGIYASGPYNTSASTSTINTNGAKHDGEVVEQLKQAVTPHSTYVQVKTTTGETFWIDIHALKTPTSDPILENKAQDYDAVIDQSTRRDGVYLNGPYRTATGTFWPNIDGTKYDQQFVHVIRTERTKWSTYAEVVGDNNQAFWIDTHALTKPTYYPITDQKNVNYDAQIDEALHKNGVVDGVYQSGPYRTSADTYQVNTDSKKYDGQYGHVDQEATNLKSTYAHVKLVSGSAFWIDIHGLKKISYDKILSQQNVNYDAKIDEASRPNGIVDGIYTSGPYRTSLATSTINYDGKKYDQQSGHVDKIATTANSTYAHITLISGTAFWIDVHALKKLSFDKILSQQNVNYDAKLDEASRSNGIVDGVYTAGPYRTSLATSTINYDGKKYDQQSGHVDKLATTANSTYAHITLTSGTAFWIDVHALKKLSFDKILSQQNVNYDAKVDEASRPNGVVDGVYTSGPYRTSLATSTINYDGKKYDQQSGHVDKTATTANSTYAHIRLTNGTAFWIDVHALRR